MFNLIINDYMAYEMLRSEQSIYNVILTLLYPKEH